MPYQLHNSNVKTFVILNIDITRQDMSGDKFEELRKIIRTQVFRITFHRMYYRFRPQCDFRSCK